jgi:hypothetical protein
MRKYLLQLTIWAILMTIPALTGCGSDNKAEFPKEFAPVPKTRPVGVGTPKTPGKADGPKATIPAK